MSNSNNLLGIIAGTAIGAAIGILFAPDKGSNTRRRLSEEANAAKLRLENEANHLSTQIKDTVVAKKETLDTKVENIVSDASYKAEDVITTLEKKLGELKLKNKKLQKT